MKTWSCNRCRNTVSKSVVECVTGRPRECENCGNQTFEGPMTIGTVHRTIDRVFP